MSISASSRVMTFIVTADRERAKTFYGGILGFRLSHEDDHAAVFDLNGAMLRISTVTGHLPQPHTVLGWEVPDIVEAVQALRGQDVAFKIYDGFEQDPLGIWSPPGGGTRIAWFTDPDGNLLSLTQF